MYVVLTSCAAERSPAPAQAGWHYDLDPRWPGAIYNFADQANTKIYGRCHTRPVFSLSGGDYRSGTTSFALGLDGKWRSFDASDGNHGRILIVENNETVRDLAAAEKITFRIGGWERTAPGSPLIGRLIRDCEKLAVQLGHSTSEAMR
jgi:hypothetical protein